MYGCTYVYLMHYKLKCSIDSTENQFHLEARRRLHMQIAVHLDILVLRRLWLTMPLLSLTSGKICQQLSPLLLCLEDPMEEV